MKHKRIMLILVLLGFSTGLTAQSYRNKQLALISYNYNIHQNIKPQFDEFAYLFPDTKDPKIDKTISILKNNTWFILKDGLEEKTGMYIFPINAHGKDFKYDVYEFPEMTINKALRKGTSKYYIKVDVTISAFSSKADKGYGSIASKDTTKNLNELPEGSLIPVVTIEVTTYTREGIIPMQKVVGSATVTEPWIISTSTFEGLKKGEKLDLNNPNSIMGLVNTAITNLLGKF